MWLTKDRRLARIAIVMILVAAGSPLHAGDAVVCRARDSLKELTDASADAQQCLSLFAYKAEPFDVRIEPCPEKDREKGYDRLVRFPSPIPSGSEINDLVSMEWYQPKDEAGKVRKTPAVVVIHESGSSMPAGRAFAQGLRDRGWHAVLMHLPYYGERRGPGQRADPSKLIETMRQGIADVRRARDAVAVLPGVDAGHIGLQGTSLGGFVSSTAASLDRCYDSVYIMLAGGDLYNMFQNGKQDTEKIRKKLEEVGITGEKLRELLTNAEPTRVAHRLDPKTTWMYSALQDDVVPIRNARQLARAARIPSSHHIQLVGGHYTAALWLPGILDHMSLQLNALTAVDSSERASDKAEGKGTVLRHVVMYKFKDEIPPAQVQEVVDAFAALPKKIDAIVGFEYGTNVSQEGKSEGFTHVFVVTFRDAAGRDTYLKHPAHDAYVQIVRNRREKVIVFDYEAPAK